MTERTNRKVPILSILIVVVASFVVLMIIFLNGTTTVQDGNMENRKTDLLVCTSNVADYAVMPVQNMESYEIRFNITFIEDKISTIGLNYEMGFANAASTQDAYNIANSNLGHSMIAAGINSVSGLNYQFNLYDKQLFLSLYAKDEEIDYRAAPFFMIETDDKKEIIPQTKKDYLKNYQAQNFKCEEK